MNVSTANNYTKRPNTLLCVYCIRSSANMKAVERVLVWEQLFVFVDS